MNLKHILKKTITLLSIFLITIIGIFVSMALWVYLYPHDAWKFAQSHFLPQDMKIEWKQMRITADHTRGLSWDLEVFFEDLLVEKQSPSISAQIDQIQLLAHATLFSPKTEIHIQNLILKSNSPLILKTEPSLPTTQDQPFDPRALLRKMTSIIDMLKSYQQRIDIDQVDIHFSDLRYKSGNAKPITASAQISKPSADSKKIEFDLQLKDISAALSSLSLDGAVELLNYNTSAPFLTTKMSVKGSTLNTTFPLTLIYQNDQLRGDSEFDLSYQLKSSKIVVKPKIEISANQKEFFIHLLGNISGIPGPLPKLQNVNIVYKMPFQNGGKDWLSSKSHLAISAPIPLFFITPTVRKQIELKCKCQLIQSVGAKFDADIWLEQLLSPSDKPYPAIASELRLQNIVNNILSADLGATLEVFRTKRDWLFKPTLDSQINIKRFQDILAILRANHILIPAPLSVLEGQVDFIAKSPMLIQENTGQITAQAKLSTNLQSSRQKVNVKAQLNLEAPSNLKTIAVGVDAFVDDLWLELPPLDPVNGLPRLVNDSRIQLEPITIKKRPAIKLLFSFKIQTTKPDAIRLFYPLAHPHIPISVNYEHGTDDKKGVIKIGSLKIKYLRREIFVESLKLDLVETTDADFPIDGKFYVNQTDYKVMIRVVGTIKKPTIDLSSEPYLDRADIVSVLLFDRTRENLAGGDAEAAGNAQAAMADRAVGLFGLWAFASTPIRSVSYNSITKEYSATVVLGEGLTAGIGTSFDKYTSFEIRKRLSKRWMITTSWVPSNEEDKSGEVLLQWENRYE